MTTNRYGGESRREVGLEGDGGRLIHLVPEEGIEPSRDYSQGILSQLTSSIDHNSGHVSPYWTS